MQHEPLREHHEDHLANRERPVTEREDGDRRTVADEGPHALPGRARRQGATGAELGSGELDGDGGEGGRRARHDSRAAWTWAEVRMGKRG